MRAASSRSPALRHHVVAALVRAVVWGLGRVPVAARTPLAMALGGIVGRWDHRRRKLAGRALQARLGLPKVEADRVALDVYRELGRGSLDWLPDHPPPVLSAAARAALEAVREEGRGAVFVTAHFGRWEGLAAAVAGAGHPVTVVVRSPPNPALRAWMNEARRRRGLELVERGAENSPKALLRALRRGRILGVLLDQNIRGRSVDVEFFGAVAPTLVGPARLALRSGVPILFGWVEGVGDEARVEVERLLSPPGDLSVAARVLTVELTRRIEAVVRRRPAGWVWFHQRWVDT